MRKRLMTFPKLCHKVFVTPSLAFGCFSLLALCRTGSMDAILASGVPKFVHFSPVSLTSSTVLDLTVLLLPLPLALALPPLPSSSCA